MDIQEEMLKLINESEENLKDLLCSQLDAYKGVNMICIKTDTEYKWRRVNIPLTETEETQWNKALELAKDLLCLRVYERQQKRIKE